MKKLLLLVVIAISFSYSQDTFTSNVASGNWNAAGSWTGQVSDGDGIPDADDNVIIQAAQTITVDANSACNNLTLQGVSSGSRLSIGTNVLEVNGTLNGDGTTLSTTLITTGSTGWLRFVGTSRTLIGTNWAGSPNDWGMEVALNSGQTGTATTAIKAKRIRIASGTLSTTNEIRPDSLNVASSGILLIETGATLSCTRASRTGTANTPFASFTINGTGKATFSATATMFPSATTVLTFSSSSTIEFTGTTTASTIVDRSYEGNLIFSGGAGSRTWTLAANRTVGGNITVVGSAIFQVGGAQVTVSGNVTVDEGAQIGCSNNSGTIVAAASGTQTFTLNGFCRVSSNVSQAPNPTTGFNRQYAFDAYSIGANSIVSFRNPTASASVSVNIDQPVGVSFANVEFYDLQTAAFTTTFLVRQNIAITGSIAFPRIASGQAVVFDLNGFTLQVGKQILSTLGTLGSNTGNTNSAGGTRTFTMTGTLELNGTASQNTLGGTDLPAAFTNLKLNNSSGVTIANAVTVSNTLTLAGNNSYTNIANISGYTGLEYAATTAQTTGSEFGASITNLVINNSNGVTLGASKSVTGTLTLTNGNLIIGANDLTLSAAVAGTPGATKHIVTDGAGVVKKNIATSGSYLYPVGYDASTYNPVTVALDGASTADDISVKVASGISPAVGNNNTAVQSTWTLSEAVGGGSNATLTFQWTAAQEGNIFARSTSAVWRHNGSDWVNASGGSASGSDPYTLSNSSVISSFGSFIVGNDGALPVEVTSFTAAPNGKNIDLKWSTASEQYNRGFEVERLSRGTWTKVAFIDGAGNSNAPKQYGYTDKVSANGKYSYRLKQIDHNGTFKYVANVETSVNIVPNVFTMSQNFPNPFNPTTAMEFTVPKSEHATVKVFDLTGREVATLFNGVAQPGQSYSVRFDGSKLASGVYIYTFRSASFSATKKMLLVK